MVAVGIEAEYEDDERRAIGIERAHLPTPCQSLLLLEGGEDGGAEVTGTTEEEEEEDEDEEDPVKGDEPLLELESTNPAPTVQEVHFHVCWSAAAWANEPVRATSVSPRASGFTAAIRTSLSEPWGTPSWRALTVNWTTAGERSGRD